MVSLENQVKAVRLQLKQYYHHRTEKIFQPVVDITKIISEEITKTLTENSISKNKA